MNVTFWGVRGSIPTPGPETVRIGGNTPCVQVTTPDGDLVILDAGTGIRLLGKALLQRPPRRIIGHIFLSHTHWDHIQGLPFFAPARRRGNRFTILGGRRVNERLEHVLAGQYLDTYLPFSLREMEADILIKELRNGETLVLGEHTLVTARKMDHPGGVFAYRVRWRDRVVVYATDLQHPAGGVAPALVELAAGADLLIHDAHFVDSNDMPDWGHSSWSKAIEVARAAGVRRLALFHHSPDSDDDMLERREREAQADFSALLLSREGETLALRP